MSKQIFLGLIAMLALATLGLQGCVDEGWGPAHEAHERAEFNYGPKHEVCNTNGYNCMVCDADTDYCRRVPSYEGPYSRDW